MNYQGSVPMQAPSMGPQQAAPQDMEITETVAKELFLVFRTGEMDPYNSYIPADINSWSIQYFSKDGLLAASFEGYKSLLTAWKFHRKAPGSLKRSVEDSVKALIEAHFGESLRVKQPFL